jgi:excisionase family DNA binding protein
MHNNTKFATVEEFPKLAPLMQVAAAWGIKPDTLRAWARRNRVPRVRIGRAILFRLEDLEKVVEDGSCQ